MAVEAAAVSFVDGLMVEGRYQMRPPLPWTPGSAVAGRVRAVGEGVGAVEVIDPVAVPSMAGGGFTTHPVVPAAALCSLPPGLAPELAATAIENYSTLSFALAHRVRVEPGEWVLVLGAGGANSLVAVDVAGAAGARVLGAASSEAKRTAATAAGAEVVLGLTDLKERPRGDRGRGGHRHRPGRRPAGRDGAALAHRLRAVLRGRVRRRGDPPAVGQRRPAAQPQRHRGRLG